MMDPVRLEFIEYELRRRLISALAYMSIDEITNNGRKMQFDVILAAPGYPFRLKPFMDKHYLKPIVTHEEYNSEEYDLLITKMFEEFYGTLS